jgi:anti-sigma regulatory factor (Ser/Thr protein kinase)
VEAVVAVDRTLPALATSASEARRLLRDALADVEIDDSLEAAQIAISEIVTNALVHAGTPMRLRVLVTRDSVRVELSDGSPHLPHQRDYASNAITGRGLHVISEIVDRWGAYPIGDGKVVWFEIREGDESSDEAESPVPAADHPSVVAAVEVQLLNMPLLMHAAWQEHAAALLRELLLVRLDKDLDVLEHHAAASDALSVLFEQVPAPDLLDDPAAIMGSATDPDMSVERLELAVPELSAAHFDVLDTMLDEAVVLAERGELLSPPTQPEIQALRQWLCGQVREQSRGGSPLAWTSSLAVAPPRVEGALELVWDPAPVAGSDLALVAADDTNLILAVSRSAAALLRYDAPADLVGQRLLSMIPARYHQAHIAGFTLHLVNGRSPLLGNRVTAPVACGDGSERLLEILIEADQLPNGRRVFVAELAETGSS